MAFLKQPGTYGIGVKTVEVKETHMSVVFLAGNRAYKLKKPVKYQYLDLRSLESRFRNCQEEMLLNKRLARDIYLEMIPLTINEKGKFELNGRGTIADWLVEMIRLQEDTMLDHAIINHTISESLLRPPAILLAEFYNKSPGISISTRQYRHKLKREIISASKGLLHPSFQLPSTQVSALTQALIDFLSVESSIFDKRLWEERVIEAHGDLRPEHVCLKPYPAIIDCLEFNRQLRIMDTAEELSFLAMECEMLGDKLTGKIFFETYSNITSDFIPESLTRFFKMKKACLRAFLVARHIKERVYRQDPKWLSKARAYLQLAEQYLPIEV